ncbi:tsukushi [Pangasianodon hypophthalmus]|uniref:tsukushi n=1 Tax=Pangasianodon hypophthalmus TaxID=310915 RepID=UPI00230733D8|nr:tsukushi [Pangasianodon hypophthalmus]
MAILLGGTVAALLVLLFTRVKTCHPTCRCEEQSFGLFNSFSLTKVDCSGLGPNTIPVSIPLETSSLDLSSNGIHSIEGAVLSGPGYTTLSSLNLSNNLISVMNGSVFSKLHYLETLDLSWNSIQKLVEGFSGLPLAEVDLSHNSIHEINLNMFQVQDHGRPLSVDLSYNLLMTVIRSKLSQPLNIQSLNLAGNELTSVPSLQDISLRFLTLDENPISVIDEQSFAGLKYLIHLSLSSMPELHTIKPQSLQDLQNLQVLDLSNNNKLKTLSAEAFRGLTSLQELNLSKCWVTSLPANILQLLPSIKSIALGEGINCWRIQKQEQFHRHITRSKANAALICDVAGVIL